MGAQPPAGAGLDIEADLIDGLASRAPTDFGHLTARTGSGARPEVHTRLEPPGPNRDRQRVPGTAPKGRVAAALTSALLSSVAANASKVSIARPAPSQPGPARDRRVVRLQAGETGGERRARRTAPPSFVAPKSLGDGGRYPRVRSGEAPIRPNPQGLEGTEPASP